MNNIKNWKPSKYVYKKGELRASRNPNEVMISSRLVADIIAQYYEAQIKKHAKGRLLDLGCGKVPLYECYKKYVDENICVDWGNTMHKNIYLDFEHDLNAPLPFNDEEFDTIILSDVLEHIYNPILLWREMHRVLKKEGKIIMNVPFFYWLHEVPFDYFRYTEYAFRRFAEETESKVHVLTPYGGAIEVLGDISAKLTLRIPWIGKAVSSVLQTMTFSFCKSSPGRKIYQKSSSMFPLGYFLVLEK